MVRIHKVTCDYPKAYSYLLFIECNINFSFHTLQHVHIHCHCPRDSRVLGLSQIKIMGTSLHGSQNLVNQELQTLKGQAVR